MLPPVGNGFILPTAPWAAFGELPSTPGAALFPPANWKACGYVSTFSQKVLEETKSLIAQKTWCWQLANKLLLPDNPCTLLLLGSNYPFSEHAWVILLAK
jgi:hypothetical protein